MEFFTLHRRFTANPLKPELSGPFTMHELVEFSEEKCVFGLDTLPDHKKISKIKEVLTDSLYYFELIKADKQGLKILRERAKEHEIPNFLEVISKYEQANNFCDICGDIIEPNELELSKITLKKQTPLRHNHCNQN